MDTIALSRGLEIAVTGMLVVFLALLLLIVVVSLFKRFGEPQSAKPATTATSAAAPPPPPVPAATVPAHLIVVLAVAASEMLGQPVQVTRVRYRQLEADGGWARQGRIGIMAGHQTVQRKAGDKK